MQGRAWPCSRRVVPPKEMAPLAMGDCPTPSPSPPVPQRGTVPRAQPLAVLEGWGQGPATWIADGSGCCPWCAVCTELLSVQEALLLGTSIYTQRVAGRVVNFSWVAGLCCRQHRRVGVGVAGWGTLHSCYCHIPERDRWHGLGTSLGCLSCPSCA